jgi:hypothetical protein
MTGLAERRRFRYPRSIDYTKTLTPPLDTADAVRLNRQLKAKAAGDDCPPDRMLALSR